MYRTGAVPIDRLGKHFFVGMPGQGINQPNDGGVPGILWREGEEVCAEGKPSGRLAITTNPRGARFIVPLQVGSVVDVGFGFELGEHGLEERFVGVGSAGDGQLHFLGGNGVIAAVRGEASLRQVA